MSIKTKLSEKDFFKASFHILFSRPAVKIFAFFWLAILVFPILTSPGDGITYVMPILFFVVIFLSLNYFSLKRNYTSNKAISENVEYTFTESSFIAKGESFSSEILWSKVYKVTLSKNWLLIWHSNQIANPIARRNMSESDILTLKNILSNYRVKNNL